MHSQEGRSRFLKAGRSAVSILLVLVFVFSAASQVRERIELSRVINPSSAAGVYFRGAFRFGRGVVPSGNADFISPANAELNARQMDLVILDKAKFLNDQPDYDAIGIRWQGHVYQLAAQDDLILPLMKFIGRGSYIAYTLSAAIDEPEVTAEANYFRINGLVPAPGIDDLLGGYVAKELTSHGVFLNDVDLFTKTEVLRPLSVKATIMRDFRTNSPLAEIPDGSYVNADFHVRYKAFLKSNDGKRVINVGGLPLRYYWEVTEDGSARIDDVEVFVFPADVPEDKFELQDKAVMFFQTAAILRQFKDDNPREFRRFLREVGAVVGTSKAKAQLLR